VLITFGLYLFAFKILLEKGFEKENKEEKEKKPALLSTWLAPSLPRGPAPPFLSPSAQLANQPNRQPKPRAACFPPLPSPTADGRV